MKSGVEKDGIWNFLGKFTRTKLCLENISLWKMSNACNMFPKVSLSEDFYKENSLIVWEGDPVLLFFSFYGSVYSLFNLCPPHPLTSNMTDISG